MTAAEFLDRLESSGWTIERRDPLPAATVAELGERFSLVPEDYLAFLRITRRALNRAETAWFLCLEDFEGHGDYAFSWDEFERQSLEAAKGFPKIEAGVKEFWAAHIPIALSVQPEYAFLAVRIVPPAAGGIVHGYEPEYEEVDPFCASFSILMERITRRLDGENDSVLGAFV